MGWHGRLSTLGNIVNRVGAEVYNAFRWVVIYYVISLNLGGGIYKGTNFIFSPALLYARSVHSDHTFLYGDYATQSPWLRCA